MDNELKTLYGGTKIIKSLNIDARNNEMGIVGFIPIFENYEDAEKFSENECNMPCVDIKK